MSDVKLNCAIVQDLLPSYVEGLTSSETSKSIEEHLPRCQQCSSVLSQMQEEPVADNALLTSNSAEPALTYMRKVKRRHVLSILVVAVAAMVTVALIVGFFLNTYFSPKPLTPEQITQLDVYELDGGAIYLRISMEEGYDITSSWYDGEAFDAGSYRVQVAFAHVRVFPGMTIPRTVTHLLVDSAEVSEVILRVEETGEELVLWQLGDTVPNTSRTLNELNNEVGFIAPWIGPISQKIEAQYALYQ